jgi:hypothetical protein
MEPFLTDDKPRRVDSVTNAGRVFSMIVTLKSHPEQQSGSEPFWKAAATMDCAGRCLVRRWLFWEQLRDAVNRVIRDPSQHVSSGGFRRTTSGQRSKSFCHLPIQRRYNDGSSAAISSTHAATSDKNA